MSALKSRILEYYKASMPYCDKTDVPGAVLESFAEHAAFLRKEVEWCRALPEALFLEHVAAYRINSERIEDCRRFFYEKVMPVIAGLPLKEAILEVNLWCAQNASYHQADARTANAMTVYKSGYGRCGEESTFAVTVLRSVGIAARQVYAPLWSHCDDNHAWVEVYCEGRWQYLGACEPEPVLNRGWFDLPASRAMLIHGRSFSPLAEGENLISREGGVTYYNVTDRYGETVDVTLEAKDSLGQPLSGAQISLEVLNFAHFGRIGLLTADEAGRVSVRLGKGSLQLSCMRNGRYLSALTELEKSGVLRVQLEESHREVWNQGYFAVPEGRVGRIEAAQDFVAFQEKLETAEKMRRSRIASFFDAKRAARFPEAAEILQKAGGNFSEVIRFLEADDNPYRLKLLRTLAEKDYYDLKAEVLNEHLECALAYAGKDQVPEEIFEKYLLCPRLEWEELSPWRREILEVLGEKAAAYRQEPLRIWREICENVKSPAEDAYDTLRRLPCSVLQSGIGSLFDRRNLFMAAARSCGVPARLDPVTGRAQYYQNGAFHMVETEPDRPVCGARTAPGRLTFLSDTGRTWTYWTDWCLERLEESGYGALDLSGLNWSEGKLVLHPEPGEYRLTTAVRLTNGDQYFAVYCFAWEQGEKTIRLRLHDGYRPEEQGTALPELEIPSQEKTVLWNQQKGAARAACIWIREGEEPTEHILNEMLERISDVKKCQGYIWLISLQPPKEGGTLSRVLQALPEISFVLAKNLDAAQKAAEAMGIEKRKYPVALVADEANRGIYASSGYNVGSVAQILMRM